MRNGQLKPGYNIQIRVEAEYVTGVGVFTLRGVELGKDIVAKRYVYLQNFTHK